MDQTGRSLISLEGLNREDILWLLSHAAKFEANPNSKILDGKIVATLFFEPSTRTRLSFETAVNRLGGRVIGFPMQLPPVHQRVKHSRTP